MAENKWIGSNGVTVAIYPFMNSGFKIITLDCEETVGGNLANGVIEFVHDGNDEATRLITEQETVDIELGTDELGVILNIHGIITNRTYNHNHFGIAFVCMPEIDFCTRRSYLNYETIDMAIDSLWKGYKEIRTTSDLTGGVMINQAGEYDRDFLKRLCESYKKDTIYAFALDGLIIKDLIGIDSTGNQEPYWTMTGNGDQVIQGSTADMGGADGEGRYKLFYDYKLYKEPERVWKEEENKSLNLDVVIFDNRYRIIHKDYSMMRENAYNNQKLYNSKMYNQLHVTSTQSFLPYRLGDVIYYKRMVEQESVPFEIYIISQIKYHYRTEPSGRGKKSKFPFKMELTLHCLEEKGVIMNTIDPKDDSKDIA